MRPRGRDVAMKSEQSSTLNTLLRFLIVALMFGGIMYYGYRSALQKQENTEQQRLRRIEESRDFADRELRRFFHEQSELKPDAMHDPEPDPATAAP
jgi:hypothetical protein